ncbi:MAG: hypothetical protein AB4911_25350 [Oscillochloridaceae bacterium umkhey_bin13]
MSQNRGNGWISLVIFFLLVFGSRVLPPVANWLSQVTGLAITAGHLIIGLVVLSVVISIATPFLRGLGNLGGGGGGGGDTRLPTGSNGDSSSPYRPNGSGMPSSPSQPYPDSSSPSSTTSTSRSSSPYTVPTSSSSPYTPPPSRSPTATTIRPPTGEQRIPGPPRFEPIIDPRILMVGIVGVAALIVVFGVAIAIIGI